MSTGEQGGSGSGANPYREQHAELMDSLLESMAATRKLIDDCHDCGLPVEQAREENAQQVALVTALKAKFFPGRP